MELIDILYYRYSGIEESKMIPFTDVATISSALERLGLLKKESGLCAAPWNMYYSLSYQDERKITYSRKTPINVCDITVNEATSTLSKIKYYYGFRIVQTEKDYYITALAQTSRYHKAKGAESLVYKFQLSELPDVLSILFESVEKIHIKDFL